MSICDKVRKSLVRIDVDKDIIRLKTPFKREFVKEMRKLYAEWDSMGRQWVIDLNREKEIIDLCKKYFSEETSHWD